MHIFSAKELLIQTLNMPHVYNLMQDPIEKYPIDKVDVSGSWVFPVMFKSFVEFQQTLSSEPPIQLGTPDPYVPQFNY